MGVSGPKALIVVACLMSHFLQHLFFEYFDLSRSGMLAGYETKGVKESPDGYLQLIWTYPAHQGQGSCSLLQTSQV
jgi:hypothetical protein